MTFISLSTTLYFPLKQYRISLIRNSQDLTLWSCNSRDVPNTNFVNKDVQKISFGRIHQSVDLVEYNIHCHCIREIWKFVQLRNSHISLGRCLREIWLCLVEEIFISPFCDWHGGLKFLWWHGFYCRYLQLVECLVTYYKWPTKEGTPIRQHFLQRLHGLFLSSLGRVMNCEMWELKLMLWKV